MIGIFDSGCGGVSVYRAIRERAPRADIVYFGDIRNAPYGSKSSAELAELVKRGVERLGALGATEIVSACNSVSYSVLEGAAEHGRIIEMSRPTARMMRRIAGARVLLLATEATVRSGMYREALWSIVSLDEVPVPGLAGAIEREEGTAQLAAHLRNALASRAGERYDHVLLGCTHYPLVRSLIEKELDGMCEHGCIDPAEAVADEVSMRFTTTGGGTSHFYISRDSHAFRNYVAPYFLDGSACLQVVD